MMQSIENTINDILIASILLISLYVPVSIWGQESQGSTAVALENIEIHGIKSQQVNTKSLTKAYRFRKLNRENIEDIKKEIQSQYSELGYYLVKIDSFKVQRTSAKERAILHLYVSLGPNFLLKDVIWAMPDSFRNQFALKIEEKVTDFVGQPYTNILQAALFRDIVEIFENEGYPLCKVITIGFDVDSVKREKTGFTLRIDINPGPLIRVTGLQLPPKSDLNVRYLEQTFRFRKNEIYNDQRVQRYDRILKKQDFIKQSSPSGIIIGKDSLYYLQLNYVESPFTTFDGIVGYIPPPANDPTESGFFTGMINLSLKNLFGTGRRMDVFWQKPDRLSEEFRVKYREPFILGLPLHIGGSLNRLVRDTTYIEWQYSLNTEIPLNENLTGLARFYRREVFPDSLASALLRLPQTRATHTELGLQWDTRNDFLNPRSGLLLSLLFDYGTQKNSGPSYLIEEDSLLRKTKVAKMTGQLALFFRLWRKQVLALNFNGVFIGYEGQKVQIPDMFWFGGATTVRGYRENQFFGERVGWVNIEYRFLLGPSSRLFVFNDLAFYRRRAPYNTEEFLSGYGLGIRFPSPLGILQIDYGLDKDLNFSEGKIHFRLINEF